MTTSKHPSVVAGLVNFSEEQAPALIHHRADGGINAVAFPQVSSDSDGTVAGQTKHLNGIEKGTEPGTYV